MRRSIEVVHTVRERADCTVYRLDSKSLHLVNSIPLWLVWAKVMYTVHVAPPKTFHKLVSTILAKQATCAKSLLSFYMYFMPLLLLVGWL